IGLYGSRLGAPFRIEAPYECRVGAPPFGRGDILEAVLLPQAVGVAKRTNAAFGADAGAREHEHLHALVDTDGGAMHRRILATPPAIVVKHEAFPREHGRG